MKFENIKSKADKNNLKAHIFWQITVLVTNFLLLVIFYKTKFFTNSSVAIFAFINLLLANKLILNLLYRLVVWILVTLGHGKYDINSSFLYIDDIRITCTIWSFVWLLIDISTAQQTQY